MAGKKIPKEVKEQVEEIVDKFNQKVIRDPDHFFVIRYRGIYLYLDRNEYGRVSERGRMKYNGKIDNWDFAIFKYSSESYDPNEWFFPGEQYLDGTIEGGMKACIEAYPQ